LLDQFCDIIVVGGGPAGSYIAYELASSGHNVVVLERKSAPGINACCTGIISTECFQRLDPGPGVVLKKVDSAKFFSPSGRRLRFRSENVQAYVVNRLLLDKALACKAESSGARYFLSSRVVDIIRRENSMQAEVLCSGARRIFNARAVVLANGFGSQLPKKLGLGEIESFLVGAQAEIEVRDVDELEVHFGQKVAPGAFAWLVPTSTNKAYIGLLATSQAKLHLQQFLSTLFAEGRVGDPEAKIEQKAIPIKPLPRSYGHRVVVIGDAAGQVKPTTGGGIYFGHIGAKIAAEVLTGALDSDNLTAAYLARYQKQWKARMGREISRAYWARWAYARLSDRQIDGIFDMLNSNGTVDALVRSDSFSFDWHSKLITTVLRRSSAYPLLRAKRLFSREAEL
jgi:digeranylgeranylglycerophospholipid reductase